jgi:teichoic acid transport system permease protein
VSDRLYLDEDREPSPIGAPTPLRVGKQRPPRSRRNADGPPAAPKAARAAESAPVAPRTREYSDVVYTFEPHTSSMPPLRSYLASLWERRRFTAELAKAELRGPRSNTALGALWGVVDPLLQAMIYFFLIIIIRGGSGGRTLDFLPILIAGILLFTFTSGSFTGGGRSILNARGLMLNSTFPRALLPIAAVYGALLTFLPSIGIYATLHLALGHPIHLGLLFLPLVFLLQVVLSLGLALLFATLTVFIRDTVKLMGYLTRVLLFTSPIIFPVSQIPEGMRPWLHLNPLYCLFATYQVILGGAMPEPLKLLQIAGWAVFFLLVGAWVFLRHERAFAIRL